MSFCGCPDYYKKTKPNDLEFSFMYTFPDFINMSRDALNHSVQ